MNFSPIKRWFVVATFVFSLTLACGLLLNAFTPKVYVATAEIQINMPSAVDTDRLIDPNTVITQFHTIQSPGVLQPIITDLQLDKSWAKRNSTLDPLAYLHSHLKLDHKANGSVITISVSSDLPTEAADIANAIADRYKTLRDVEDSSQDDRGLDVIRSQIEDQEQVVTNSEFAWDRMKKDLLKSGAAIPPEEAEFRKLQQEILAAGEDYDARLMYLHQGEFRSDPAPFITKRAMRIECDKVQLRIKISKQKMNALNADLAANVLPEPYRSALCDYTRQQSLLDDMEIFLRQSVEDRYHPESSVRILSRAEPPSHSIQPSIPLGLLFLTASGLFLSVTVASFVELLLWLRR